MGWSKIATIVTACSLVLTACSGESNKNLPQPAPTTPTASVNQPTLSPEEAKKQAAEAKAAREAHERELRLWAASIEKMMKTKSSTDEKLSVIITAYCKFPYDPKEVVPDKAAVLKKFYDASWQAGKWNKDLESAVRQTGACPQQLPQRLS